MKIIRKTKRTDEGEFEAINRSALLIIDEVVKTLQTAALQLDSAIYIANKGNNTEKINSATNSLKTVKNSIAELSKIRG